MTDDFMTNWLSLLLSVTVGLAPSAMAANLIRFLYPGAPEDTPTGCLVFGILLFVAGLPLSYWCFQTFGVVWR